MVSAALHAYDFFLPIKLQLQKYCFLSRAEGNPTNPRGKYFVRAFLHAWENSNLYLVLSVSSTDPRLPPGLDLL